MQRSAVGLLARAHARRQLGGLALAAGMLAIGGGVTLATLAGAERTSTAAARAFADSAFPEISVDIPGIRPEAVAELRAAPEVKQLATLAFAAIGPADSGLVPGVDVAGVMPVEGYDQPVLDRLRIAEGRMPRPDRVGEVVVNPTLARQQKLKVGDTLTLAAFRQSEVLSVFQGADPPAPTGTRREVRVVGIGRDLSEIVSSDEGDFGVVVLSPAWFKHYGAPLADITQSEQDTGVFRLMLRANLRNADADADRFLQRVFDAYDGDATTIFSETRADLFESSAATLRVETIALVIFGTFAGLATVITVAQALARLQFLGAAQMVAVARALGIDATSRAAAAALPSVLAVLAGTITAALIAYATSGFFPRGLGRRLEPEPGLRLAAVPMVGLSALLVLALVGIALGSAKRVTRGLRPEASVVPRLRVRINRPEVGIGLRMALHSGRGATRVPARQTVTAAVLGVTGVVAAITFGASLQRLIAEPRLYGNVFDSAVVFQGDAGAAVTEAAGALVGDERISGLTRTGSSEVVIQGERLSAEFVHPEKGVAGPSLLSGRAPASPNEIAIDPTAVKGKPKVGNAIRVATANGSERVLVVGHLPGTGFARVAMTQEGAERLGIDRYDETALLVVWRDGVDIAAADRSLAKTYAEVRPVGPSESIQNLQRVRAFPYALAVLLGVLAAAAVGHMLISAVRRRARDLAMLKAVGFRKSQIRATVRWQALTVAVLALLVGAVLGTAAGRGAWASVTSGVHVIFEPAIPPALFGVVGLATLVLAVVLAAVPARYAAKTPTARVLRVE